jgi:hypothetical protein
MKNLDFEIPISLSNPTLLKSYQAVDGSGATNNASARQLSVTVVKFCPG